MPSRPTRKQWTANAGKKKIPYFTTGGVGVVGVGGAQASALSAEIGIKVPQNITAMATGGPNNTTPGDVPK